FCAQLLPRLVELRARFGRPHWIAIDEAHHVLPRDWQATEPALPLGLDGLFLVTVHPQHVSPAILAGVSVVVAVGTEAAEPLRESAAAMSRPGADAGGIHLEPREGLAWPARDGAAPFRMRVIPAKGEHQRHARKYAEGELSPEESFYFRGPDGRLN